MFESSSGLKEGSTPVRGQPVTPSLSWVRVSRGAPYFETDDGRPWTPIGHNEAIAWPRLASGSDALHAYFKRLQASGVTCLRLMLEYAQDDEHFLEQPLATFNWRVVQLWDEIFRCCEQYEIRLLLTPFDTYWMWKRWSCHPYSRARGGTCDSPRRLLICTAARQATKARLQFAIDRWGHSGALFAWDLWNEIHPAYADDDAGHFDEFIADLAGFVRDRERAAYGRAHPLTVSAFGPLLSHGFRSAELGQTDPDPRASAAVFAHPALDFATVHTYAHGTIDDPLNTVDPAVAMGTLTQRYISQIPDGRPYFDSEHGPIHTFKDRELTLPERFDDEYFRHLQWAHFASGGAGGGLRWANRTPHQLTDGMHAAQRALARFVDHIDWGRFNRRPISADVLTAPAHYIPFCCGDDRQMVLWLLRRDRIAADGTLCQAPRVAVDVVVHGVADADYRLIAWDTVAGAMLSESNVSAAANCLRLRVPIENDVAIALRRMV